MIHYSIIYSSEGYKFYNKDTKVTVIKFVVMLFWERWNVFANWDGF